MSPLFTGDGNKIDKDMSLEIKLQEAKTSRLQEAEDSGSSVPCPSLHGYLLILLLIALLTLLLPRVSF